MSGVELLVDVDPTGAGIGLALAPTNIDLSSSTLTLNWWATGCRPTSATGSIQPEGGDAASILEVPQATCGQSSDSFNIWVDNNPTYAWNASNVILRDDQSAIHSFTSQETFDTSHNFTWISKRQFLAQRRQHSVSAWYPFDRYAVSTTIGAFDTDGSPLPIYFVHLYAGLSGYNLQVDAIEHVRTSNSDEALHITFSIRRCEGVKLFAITLFLTNYVLAAAMVWVAVCAHYGPSLPESALFLPLTNILLLPQLRGAMPGVPDFGIFMDLFGYYVNISAICFAALFMFFKIVSGRRPSSITGVTEHPPSEALPLYRKGALPIAVERSLSITGTVEHFDKGPVPIHGTHQHVEDVVAMFSENTEPRDVCVR
ncbi:hypothetical protein BD310DRAFT_942559 [Dichomitus squalens]|uniref:Uncharacterized protein n=1 Tax=Dichomitus squalens TaxID=114155 RepID=A0A4Q9PDA3_9APHY|nr:hypothetical protein BD310DRAFT_942559 [Dichomitus squalens]